MKSSTNEPAVVIRNLVKNYGSTPALKGLDFEVPKGGIFAYLGTNGAGKTTTINIISGLLAKDSGEIRVCGLDVNTEPVKVKERIGVVPDDSNLYPELTCFRNLDYLGELYGLDRKTRGKRIQNLLGVFDLQDRAKMPFRALSRGLKRRLVLAAAMIHNPEILFLDEPTIGLDVPSARALRKHIKHINQKGTTIFLTTHNLAEAEDLADTVCILIKGQVVKVGSPEQISRQVQRGTYLKLGLSGDIEQEVLLTACPAVQNAKKENGLWRLKVDNLNQALKQSLELAESQNLAIKEVSVDRPNLEEAFLAYVENGGSSKEAGR